ncbi:MAG: flagellin, partial [Acidobacteriota bacterium]|nr:flagellin [Acidobacteriota bacterium]
MAFSIQTNVNSLIAQENLRVNSNFQSQTIQRLTSGYRINNSGDDAAGLAIANKFRNDTAELTQGVRNANDGISTLQIIDGGMNNISKMLDRLRTLAAQSASDTFTGDRNVLNSEFQSLITEIDRQAQSIGLDTNGQFAKALSVFVGGGKTAGTGAISTANGEIDIDLSKSSVDTRSLGLKGMQVVAGSTDIGPGSATHTVAQILADGANTTSTAGFTDVYFSGPGFSDGSKIKVSVNTSGVTDTTSLAAAINTAITNAANASTQAASAFREAGIVASVHTDASGGQQLAFTSATSAFQVEAGDVLSNALLGNFASGTTGASIATTVTGANTAATTTGFNPTGVTVRIAGGGLSSAQDITFDSASTTIDLALTDLINKVGGSSSLKAAGISVSGTPGGPLTFTSARGEQLSVMVTGDTSNRLGLGTFVAGSGTTADYTTLTAGAAYNNATAFGMADFEFSLNGAASNGNAVSVNLDAGNATAATKAATNDTDQHGNTITLSVDGAGPTTVTLGVGDTNSILAAAAVNAQAGGLVTATVNSSGYLVIASNTKGAHTLTIGGTNTYGGLNGTYTGTSRSDTDLVSALNAGFAADPELSKAGLQATVDAGHVVTISSQNGTNFRLNTGGTAATANTGFGTAGTAGFTGATVGASNISVLDANGVTQTAGISFASLAYGNDDQAITISANDPNGVLQTKTITLQNDATARTGRSLDETIHYVNSQLAQSNNPTLQKIVAVKEVTGGAEKINFLSSLANFSVGVGSSANGDGLNGGTAASENSSMLGAGASVSIDTASGALQAVAAIASAITTLGTAQAAVGKAQNQLNYAIGLAQSQISNFSAAESRIRDADMAAEAANLTKAQVLQQASMAAMAQANSA